MRSNLKRTVDNRAGQKGSALAEFALVVVLLFVMLFGIVDFGRALYTYHFLSNAAREATRYAAVRGSSCDLDSSCSIADPDTGPADSSNSVVQDYVTSITPAGIDASKITTTPTWPGNGTTACTTVRNNPGCPVQVQVSYTFHFLTPIMARGRTIQMSSSSEMVISH